MDDPIQDALVQGCMAALDRCLEAGMKLPIHFAELDPKGAFLVARINEDHDFEALAISDTATAWSWPVNVMFVDAQGNNMRVVFDLVEGKPQSKMVN